MRGLLLAGWLAVLGTTAPAFADRLGVADSEIIEAVAESPIGVEGPRAPSEPSGGTVIRSSRMEAAPLVRVALAEETWTVLHARSPSGSFALVRNMSPKGSGSVLTVSLGGMAEQALVPRQTFTWPCDALEGHPTLLVRTTSGETAFAGEIACGDAVYLRPHPAP